jgi:uncharacterized protein (TIGR00730 family)
VADGLLGTRRIKTMTIKAICVYCGSGPGDDPAYMQAARALGTAIGASGRRLVYGGGKLGLMGEVAKSTIAAGGRVTGIIPEFLTRREQLNDDVQDQRIVPDMHSRKRMMFEESDAFVALPGGIGTLEELVEQLTWAQLGQHKKPILMLDIKGFWRPLIDLLAHMRMAAFIRPGLEVTYQVAEKAEDVLPMLDAVSLHRLGKADQQTLEKL